MPSGLEQTQEFGPAFLQEPDNTIFALGSEEKKVALNCEARGNPPPMYRWLFNGTEIDITIDYRYSLIDGNLIIMNPNEVRDSGKYQCLVTNSFGTIISRDAMLQFACEYLSAAFNFCTSLRNWTHFTMLTTRNFLNIVFNSGVQLLNVLVQL
ncbi:UNVERIFIED_CONTAM: hypothetical protein FKN15_043219 [Acipenser sinensis]